MFHSSNSFVHECIPNDENEHERSGRPSFLELDGAFVVVAMLDDNDELFVLVVDSDTMNSSNKARENSSLTRCSQSRSNIVFQQRIILQLVKVRALVSRLLNKLTKDFSR